MTKYNYNLVENIYIYIYIYIYSGVFCSVSIALEQCKTEGVIDVFQVIKGFRMNKTGAVTTLVCIVYICIEVFTFISIDDFEVKCYIETIVTLMYLFT